MISKVRNGCSILRNWVRNWVLECTWLQWWTGIADWGEVMGTTGENVKSGGKKGKHVSSRKLTLLANL